MHCYIDILKSLKNGILTKVFATISLFLEKKQVHYFSEIAEVYFSCQICMHLDSYTFKSTEISEFLILPFAQLSARVIKTLCLERPIQLKWLLFVAWFYKRTLNAPKICHIIRKK